MAGFRSWPTRHGAMPIFNLRSCWRCGRPPSGSSPCMAIAVHVDCACDMTNSTSTTSPKSLRECTQRAQKRVVPMHPRAAIANHALGVDEVDRPAYRPVFLPRTVERGDLRPGIMEERKRQPQLSLIALMVVQGARIDSQDGGVTGLERLHLLLQGGELAVAVGGIITDVKHQDQVALAPIMAERYCVARGGGQAEIRRLGAHSQECCHHDLLP